MVRVLVDVFRLGCRYVFENFLLEFLSDGTVDTLDMFLPSESRLGSIGLENVLLNCRDAKDAFILLFITEAGSMSPLRD